MGSADRSSGLPQSPTHTTAFSATRCAGCLSAQLYAVGKRWRERPLSCHGCGLLCVVYVSWYAMTLRAGVRLGAGPGTCSHPVQSSTGTFMYLISDFGVKREKHQKRRRFRVTTCTQLR